MTDGVSGDRGARGALGAVGPQGSTPLERVREALGKTKELIRTYISSSEVKELRSETVTLNTENLRITQACEDFENAVRDMLAADPPDPEVEDVAPEEDAAQGAQEDEAET